MASSPFPSCFRPSPTTDDHHHHPPPPPPPPSSHSINPNLNLSTYLYHTHTGLVSLTWSRSIIGRSLHVDIHSHQPFDSPPSPSSSLSSSLSFHLHIKPFIFWKKHGTKKLSTNTTLFWNLSKAKFGSGPEPHSNFYVAVVVDNHMTLLIGDSINDAYAKSKAEKPKNNPFLVLKREHVVADKIYITRARFGGRMREIQIDCGGRDYSRLCFSVDGEKVLQIKRLKWKFRGNERVVVDGVHVQISWDVYNWLFVKDNSEGHAIFMFKFEQEEEKAKNLTSLWTQQQNWNLGVYDWGKIGSSSSVSVASSGGSFGAGSSSVLDWSSVEENELVVPLGFSLLVYAWKRR